MEKYLPYKGLWWKIMPPVSDYSIPMWRISEKKDDRMCHVWMFNAFSHSLEDCYLSIGREFSQEPFKYIPIQGEYMLGVDVANGFDGDSIVSTWYIKNEDVYELLSVRDCTPKYMGRGFFKVGHIFTNSNGVHLLSILPPSLEEKTYIRYDEKPNSLNKLNEFITKKVKEIFKNGK